ncbi:MAG: hypothetical protein ACRD3B_09945 [Candidatus Sulfotelmatobacter sp.]
MRKAIEAGLLIVLATPAVTMAQSAINGTWKLDVGTLPFSTRTNVWVLKGGRYQCKSCTPPIDVEADGKDQPTPGQEYDTISLKILDDHTVRLIEKKNGQIDSDEKFMVSADGNTVTDEFANWKATMTRVAKGPAGSHALSGSWRPVKMESVSDAGLLITYKLEGDTLTMSRPTGLRYKAKLDGTVAPYEGDPEKHGVSVRRLGANTFEETDELNGKPTSVARLTVAPDGKSMTIVERNIEAGTSSRFYSDETVAFVDRTVTSQPEVLLDNPWPAATTGLASPFLDLWTRLLFPTGRTIEERGCRLWC